MLDSDRIKCALVSVLVLTVAALVVLPTTSASASTTAEAAAISVACGGGTSQPKITTASLDGMQIFY